MVLTEVTEFKGNKVLKLRKDEKDNFGLSMGLGKCKLVLESIEEIKSFVAEWDGKQPPRTPFKKSY